MTHGLQLYGIDVSPKSYFYVCDKSNDRLQKFSPAGKFIRFVGGRGEGNGQFVDPHGICFAW